jgi:serine/threonine-protein kinase
MATADTVSIGHTVLAESAGPDPPSLMSDSAPIGPGRIGGRYDVLGWVGAGGMGNVYRVLDVELDEVVALKTLRRALLDDPQMLAHFKSEVKLARRVTHRNVARVFDIGEHQGEKFLTMEYVDGEVLTSLCRDRGLSLERAIDIGLSICAGLGAAHEAGVVHLDLKPDNVLVGTDGRVVITDFGIARAFAGSGLPGEGRPRIVGTPAYMAPEQFDASAVVDARADLYALGLILYEMVAGRPAFAGRTVDEIVEKRFSLLPPDPGSARAELAWLTDATIDSRRPRSWRRRCAT